MNIAVTYVSGAGNTFTLVREGRRRFPVEVWQRLAPQLCRWTDGLLVLRKADARGVVPVLFFNPDGSTGMLCGNGARCAASIAMGERHRELTLLFADMPISAVTVEGGIRLRLPPPRIFPQERQLRLPTGDLRLWFADVGAPHVVIPIHELSSTGIHSSLEQLPVEQLGRLLRFHPAFAPTGVNVSFYTIAEDGSIQVRTYERGVEQETQACGTAAMAVALTAWSAERLHPPITILPPSRSPLRVDWEGEAPEQLQALFLEGSVEVLGTDTVEVSLEEDE